MPDPSRLSRPDWILIPIALSECFDSGVPMREECKHFQSRTYDTGEVARFCELDLAPEAPWRCPQDCPSYERRLADVGWVHGSLVEPAIEDEPKGADVAELLDAAEDIVNAAIPETLAEVDKDPSRRDFTSRGFGSKPDASPSRRSWWRWRR